MLYWEELHRRLLVHLLYGRHYAGPREFLKGKGGKESNSNENHIVLAYKQAGLLMDLNQRCRSKPTHLWMLVFFSIFNFLQRRQYNGKKKTSATNFPVQLDICMMKNAN